MIARVTVMPKPVVNDPQGITVKQGLATLGFRGISDVRIGKYIELNLEANSEHEARFTRPSPTRAYSRIVSTRIAASEAPVRSWSVDSRDAIAKSPRRAADSRGG